MHYFNPIIMNPIISPTGHPNTNLNSIDKGKELDPEITYFDRITQTKQGKHINLIDFLASVQSGKGNEIGKPGDWDWKAKIERIRSEPDESIQKKLKSQILPYVTISGTFEPRNAGGLINYSGLIAIDFDNLNALKGDIDSNGDVRTIDEVDQAQEALKNDRHTLAVFKSARGRGLCLVIKGSTKEKHLDHYRWAVRYYKQTLGLAVDESGKDLARARYVSCDPGAHMELNPTPAGLLEIEAAPAVTPSVTTAHTATQPNTQPTTHTATHIPTQVGKPPDIERIVNELVTGGHNICHDYDTWVSLSFSLATLLEEGRVYFHSISQVDATKYDYKTADTQFDEALNKGNGTVTIGTFFDMAKKAGVELHTKEERKAYGRALHAQEGGVTPKEAVKDVKDDGVDADADKGKGKGKNKGLDPDAILNFVLDNFEYTFNPLRRLRVRRQTGR